MKARVGEMEEKTREVRIRRTSKDVVGYVKYVVGKKNLVVMFEDFQKKEMCDSSLLYVRETEEVGKEVNETISDLSKRGKCEF